MPRFYFHVCNGNGFTEDEEGQELADVEAARARAVAYCGPKFLSAGPL